MELDEFLEFVSANDELGLLTVKAKTSAPTADEHLLAKFNEINEFVAANGREPGGDMANVPEFMLHQRLNAIRGNAEQCAALGEFDRHGLLPDCLLAEVAEPEATYQPDVKPELEPEAKEIESLEDIFSDDTLGLLTDDLNDTDDIFNLTHVSKERAEADHIARRKRCKEFDRYKDQFKRVQKEIADGKRLLRMFTNKGESLVAGNYYVLNGILLYLESIDISSQEKTVNDKRFRKDGRTYCVFENGTESSMLYRSLAKELYKGGKIVSDTNENINAEFYQNLHGVSDNDNATGSIYILQSLSTNPDISSIQNLYKIGYATTSVEKRIANAEKEPTYLMAPVHHVSSYQCFNINTQKFENLLHTFFGKACLDIEVADTNGKMCKPREWFIAPLEAIEMAIQLLVNGEIINYRYDLVSEQILER